jgi:hypothetical protein
VSPGMMAAKGGVKLMRLGAALLSTRRCFSTRGGLQGVRQGAQAPSGEVQGSEQAFDTVQRSVWFASV